MKRLFAVPVIGGGGGLSGPFPNFLIWVGLHCTAVWPAPHFLAVRLPPTKRNRPHKSNPEFVTIPCNVAWQVAKSLQPFSISFKIGGGGEGLTVKSDFLCPFIFVRQRQDEFFSRYKVCHPG